MLFWNFQGLFVCFFYVFVFVSFHGKSVAKKEIAFCGTSQAPKEMIQKIQVSRGPAVAKFISVTWEKGQWLFLVPLIGGRYHTIPQLAVYTTYIPLIYCQLGDYMVPIPPIIREPGFTPLKRAEKNGEDHTTRGRGPSLNHPTKSSTSRKAEGTSRRRSATWYWCPETVTVLGVKSHGSVKKVHFGLRKKPWFLVEVRCFFFTGIFWDCLQTCTKLHKNIALFQVQM